MQSIVANLAPAKGRQDHTTSPSASTSLVWRHRRVHRIPRPTLVTIAKRPSRGRGTAPLIALIWVFRQGHTAAADWHDRQFAHDAHVRFSFWPVGQIGALRSSYGCWRSVKNAAQLPGHAGLWNRLHIFLHDENLRRPQSLGIVRRAEPKGSGDAEKAIDAG